MLLLKARRRAGIEPGPLVLILHLTQDVGLRFPTLFGNAKRWHSLESRFRIQKLCVRAALLDSWHRDTTECGFKRDPESEQFAIGSRRPIKLYTDR